MREMTEKTGAMWISIADGPETGRIDTVWFRRLFDCAAGEKLVIRISACSRYRLYLNGKFVAYGPCKGGDGYQFFDSWELSEGIRRGKNELLAEVVSFPDAANPWEQVGGPDWAVSLIRRAALAVVGKTSSGRDISTGTEGWTCLRCDAMTPATNRTARWLGYTESVDISKSVRLEETDALDWAPAKPCARIDASKWGEVSKLPAYERPIPAMEMGDLAPLTRPARGAAAFEEGGVTVAPGSKAEFELDAGEETTAFIHIRARGGKGAVIRATYAEAYAHPDGKGGQVKNDRLPGDDGVLAGFADEVVADGGEFDYSPFWFRTFRFVRLEVETADEAIYIEAPLYSVTRYPLGAVSGVHSDESGWLAPLWDVSLRTLRCCMHETFEDCPYYEQMQYTMDTRLQMLFAYRVAADTKMAERTLFDYHASRLPNGILQSRYPTGGKQVIPAFALHWIFMLKDHYMQTGDLSLARRYFGTMDGVLEYFERCRGTGGLVENPGYWEFIDWVDAWDEGVPDSDGGPEASHNFVYACALGVAAELAEAMGFGGVADEYRARKAEILTLAHETFYDAERGLYRYNPGKARYCQHAQVWAVLAGAGDAAFRRRLMENLDADDSLLPCSFPMQYYLFRAYEETGMYAKTERLWDLWKTVLSQNLTTVPEIPVNARSDCHAWGSLALYEYPARVLGVRPACPGWKEILVKPEALYMKRADGRACVPDGYVDVKWSIEDGVFNIEAVLETDSPVVVELPDGSRAGGQGRKERIAAACPVA